MESLLRKSLLNFSIDNEVAAVDVPLRFVNDDFFLVKIFRNKGFAQLIYVIKSYLHQTSSELVHL
jgi:hypothetical protein